MGTRLHLASLLDDMRQLGQQTAVVEHRGVRRFATSYAALARGADWFADELVRRRIEPGERVLLWGENGAAWIACFFGCVKRGVLVVPLDASGTVAFAERIVRETSPRLIVGNELLLRSLAEEVSAVAGAGAGAAGRMTLAQVEAAMLDLPGSPDTPTAPYEDLGLDTPLQILFTSGTTGEPKGIVHTHRNLLASLTPIEREIGKYRRYEKWVHPLHFLHTLPLSHVFGQFMGLWVAPVLGAVVHYESRLEAGRLLRLLREERISVLAAVPRVLSLLRAELLSTDPTLAAELEAAQGVPIGKRWWRLRRIHWQLGYRFWAIVCGGATLPDTLESFWTTLGIALIQGYGMTETSALVTLNHPFKPARGTLGAPLPGRELRINESGELEVRGEMVATGTWRNGALRAASEENEGWLATGDLTRRDEQGRLHYLGRTGQRLVTSAGLNVYLEDVEAALAAQAGVDAAVAVAIEGPLGPEPAAVVRAADWSIGQRAVEGANASLASYQRVARWWLWPGLDLPRTATGKVRRGVVEAWVRERLRETPDARPAITPGAARNGSKPDDILLQIIADVTGRPVQPVEGADREVATLASMGVDSLGRVQLQAALERASGRSIEDGEMAAARTLGDVRRLAGLGAFPEYAVGGSPGQVSVSGGQDDPSSPLAASQVPPRDEAARPSVRSDPDALTADPATETLHREPPTRPDRADRGETFLYLRWPWAAPVQWLRTIFLEACVQPLVWLLAAPRVEYLTDSGEIAPGDLSHHLSEQLNQHQPLLLVANHVSSYDVPLLLYGLPGRLRRRIAAATGGEMLEAWRHARGNPLGPAIFWLLTILFNVFPLPQRHSFRRAFVHAGKALDRGYSVLLFPEGARSHGGPVQAFRGGIGLLAQEASVAVLPIALEQWRTDEPGRRRTLRPYGARVRVGSLVSIAAGEDARSITIRLEAAVRSLLQERPLHENKPN